MRLLAFILAVAAIADAAPAQDSLSDSLQYFLDLFPWDRIRNSVAFYLANDPALVDVVTHLQSSEWHNATHRIAALPGVQDLTQYLVDAGIPVDEIFQSFEDGIMEAKFGVAPSAERYSLYPFMEAMESAFPFGEMYMFYNGRLMEDPYLQRLFVKVTGESIKETADEVLSDPEVVSFAKRLIYMGLRVDNFFRCIYQRNGWGRPPGDEVAAEGLESAFPYPCPFALVSFPGLVL